MPTFTGTTLDEAMANAVAALGPGVTVEKARRVRRGVSRLTREWYEVRAGAPAGADAVPGAVPDAVLGAVLDDAVGGALDALLEVADAREELGAAGSWLAAKATGPDAAPDDDFAALVTDALRRVPVQADPVEAECVEAVRVEAGPVGVPHPAYDVVVSPAVVPVAVRGPRWSRAALREAGVPEEMLAHLPQHDPVDDGSWLAALTQAVTMAVWALPDDHFETAEVHGHGPRGAITMLRAMLLGCRPGMLEIGGVAVPATASDLAMAVRSCLPS